MPAEQLFSRRAHFIVRFDTVDGVPRGKKLLGEDAGAGTDVGNDPFPVVSGFLAEGGQNFIRIAGPITDVVFDAIGKPRGRLRIVRCCQNCLPPRILTAYRPGAKSPGR